ncbi:MAG: Hsp20 family protein [Alphaproteobacteria bacterium]|nr:Hsp20 family protein [Alphaproteobacteria bacterium]
MTRMPPFNSPLLLGFDELERVLERVSKSSTDGYPPYNIEQIDSDTLEITLAVAGFDRSDLSVTVEDTQLVIRGRRSEEGPARTYLHRGIATRQFQRSFVLADGIEILGADLAHGLLRIRLMRPRSGEVVRRVEIVDREAGVPGQRTPRPVERAGSDPADA